MGSYFLHYTSLRNFSQEDNPEKQVDGVAGGPPDSGGKES